MSQDLVLVNSTIRGFILSVFKVPSQEVDEKLVLVWSDVATGDRWALFRGIWGTQVSECISGLL